MSNPQDQTSVDLLAEEFVERYRKGESPRLSEYIARYPQFADEIKSLFPAKLMRARLDFVEMDEVRSDPSPNSLGLGQFGDFRLIREVGRGGMGIVYEAEQVSLGRRVALKVLPHEMLANPKHRLRFEREARAAAKLHHTNIVPVFGVGEADGQLYYVMQFIQGLALNEVLNEVKALRNKSSSESHLTKGHGTPVIHRDASAADVAKSLLAGALPNLGSEGKTNPVEAWQIEATVTYDKESLISDTPVPIMPPMDSRANSNWNSETSGSASSSVSLPGSNSQGDTSSKKQSSYFESIAQIGYQIGCALEYAHAQGVLHRDIKPSNLVLDLKGTVWITDFGLAKLDDDHELTQTGDVLGTLRYIAPETFRGQTDVRSEVYSLGLTLYEMLALRPAFDQSNRIALIDKVMSAQVEPLGVVNPDVPADLQTIIHKAIDCDPAHRYQTARELADELQRFIDDEPIKARRISYFERLTRWSRHNKGLAASLSILALLVTVIATTSTIAAGYFRTLSSQLNTTVNNLTDTKNKLTEAGQAAQKKAEEAESARRDAQTMLADMQTERGLLSASQDDAATAMLWFTTAAAQTPHDLRRKENNRLRARNWMRETVLPEALLPDSVQGDPQQLVFQPRGELLLLLKRGSLKIWNLHLEQSLSWTKELTQVTAASWSPDGRYVALGFPSGELQIREVLSGQITRRLNHPEQIEAIAFSRDGKRLALSSRLVQVWKINADAVLEHVLPHPETVYGLVFNREGNRLITACHDKLARIFAVDQEQSELLPLFTPLPHHSKYNLSPAFLNEERQIITSNGNTGKLGWWDAVTGNDATPAGANTETGVINRLEVSMDGRYVAAAHGYHVSVWNVRGDRSEIRHINFVLGVAFNPNGANLLTGCDDWMTRLWKMPDSSEPALSLPQFTVPQFTVPQRENIRLCTFSDDGALFAASGWTETRVWRLPDQNLVVGLAEKWTGRSWKARVSFDKRLVTRGAWHEAPYPVEPLSSITVVEARTGKAAGPTISIDAIVDSCLCGDNRTLAIAHHAEKTGKVSLIDVASGSPTIEPIELPAAPQSVAARPGSSHVAVMCTSGHVTVFNHRDGKQLHSFPDNPRSGKLECPRLTYSPDGSMLITLNDRQEIAVRDSETGTLRYPPLRPVLQDGIVRAFTVSADNRWLATGVTGRNALQVWNLASGTAACEPMLHPGDYYGINAVTFSSDGRLVLTANKDGRARLWDWQAGKLACPPLQHAEEVFDVAFASNDQFAVTAVRLGTAKIWELTTGKQIASLARYVQPRQISADTLTMLGDHVILGGLVYPILNLAPLFSEPTQSIESIQTLAELATGRRVELGELSGLSATEWRDRWENFQARETSAESVAGFLAGELDKAIDSEARGAIAMRAAKRLAVLTELSRLRPNVPQLQAAMAIAYEQNGDAGARMEHRQRAITLYEQQYAERPNDHVLCQQLADVLNENCEWNWRTLVVRNLHSRDGATLTRRTDGSILAAGIHGLGDIYTVTAESDGKPVVAIRLEVLPDASLPRNGPGRHESGNFQLASFRVFRSGKAGSQSVQPVRVNDAWASFTYPSPYINILGTIQEQRQQVWHVFGRPGQRHFGIFMLEKPLTLEPGESLIVELKHHEVEPAINIGCFRLSVTAEVDALKRERGRLEVRGQSLSGNLALALAYMNAGQDAKALTLLKGKSNTEEPGEDGVRLLLLTHILQQLGQTQATRENYNRMIEWMHDNTMPGFLQNQAAAMMQSIGGLTPLKAASMQQQWAAETAIHQITQQIEREPETARNYLIRGELFARLGQWRRCADDHIRHCALTPEDRFSWVRAATSLLMVNDLDGYQRNVRAMIQNFNDTREPDTAGQLCKLSLIRPDLFPVNEIPDRLLKLGLEPRGDQTLAARFVANHALYLLRKGDPQRALELATSIPTSAPAHFYPLALIIRSIAEHSLGKADQARVTLAEAVNASPLELHTLGTPEYNDALPVAQDIVNVNQIFVELLRREAAALIHGAPK